MKRFVHPLLMLLARATEKELVQTIEYLKTENRILRNKLPKRIDVTPAERAKALGTSPCGGSMKTITIIEPPMFFRPESHYGNTERGNKVVVLPDQLL